MATAGTSAVGVLPLVGERLYNGIAVLGDVAIFAGRTVGWLLRRKPGHGTFLASCHAVGVRSVPVVVITGVFIGMVLAVQAYTDFHNLPFASSLGALINTGIVRELGPVLAATMIAGRVGSAMAAELGTMRITEQVDALACLGVNPLHYLVVPRFLACVLLIPLLTAIADFAGCLGGAFMCIHVYHIDSHYYWLHSRDYITMWDIATGVIKSVFFGGAIALVSCHRGFNCRPGAEGVGRAATEAFVASFILILALDFSLAIILSNLGEVVWPAARKF